MQPDIQALWRDIMNQATLALWTQRDVALSWPIPSPEGSAQLLFFTYTSRKINANTHRIGRPDAHIIWHSEFSLAMQAGKGFPPAGVTFPVQHTDEKYDALLSPFYMEELISLFNAALVFYPHHQPPAAFLTRMRTLWEQVIPPCLMPYHELLNPDFFVWMRQS